MKNLNEDSVTRWIRDLKVGDHGKAGRTFHRLATTLDALWAALLDDPTAQLYGCATPILTLLGSA
jgi:hypothetical protein